MTSKITLSEFALSKAVWHWKGAHSMCWPQAAGVLTSLLLWFLAIFLLNLYFSTVLFTQAALMKWSCCPCPWHWREQLAELWLTERNAEQLQQFLPVTLHFSPLCSGIWSVQLVAQGFEIEPLYVLCLVESSQIVKFKVCILKHAFEMCVLWLFCSGRMTAKFLADNSLTLLFIRSKQKRKCYMINPSLYMLLALTNIN